MIRYSAILVLLAWPAGASELGFYQWVSPPRQDGLDLLTAAREQAAEAGAKAFRFYLGPRFDYLRPYLAPERRTATPAGLLDLERYRAALEDQRFSTIILTAYSALDYAGGLDDVNLNRPFSDLERAEVHRQVTELCRTLFERYGDQERTFVVVNNEADEKLMEIANYTQSPQLGIKNLIAWINARQAAISSVREEYPEARLRVIHAFELSVVNLRIARIGGRFRKTAHAADGFRAIDDVLPEIQCDLVSYSAYEATNSPYQTLHADTPPEQTGLRLRRDLERIAAAARGAISPYGRRLFGENSVMIGELGFARETFERLPTGGVLRRLQSAIDSAENWGAPWVILWQVFDAPKWGSRAWGFGAVDAAGRRPKLRPANDGCNSIAACVESWTVQKPAHTTR